jgi:putative transposase
MIRVQKVRLYPNQTMKKVLDDLCDYRRYCWNQGLALWNDMYDSSLVLDDKKLRPSERKVRNELVANKIEKPTNIKVVASSKRTTISAE